MSALSLSSLLHELAAALTKPSKSLLDPSPATAHVVEHGIVCITDKSSFQQCKGKLVTLLIRVF